MCCSFFSTFVLHVIWDLTQVWKPGDLSVVQHTPLGPSRAAAADSQWQLAEPGALGWLVDFVVGLRIFKGSSWISLVDFLVWLALIVIIDYVSILTFVFWYCNMYWWSWCFNHAKTVHSTRLHIRFCSICWWLCETCALLHYLAILPLRYSWLSAATFQYLLPMSAFSAFGIPSFCSLQTSWFATGDSGRCHRCFCFCWLSLLLLVS